MNRFLRTLRALAIGLALLVVLAGSTVFVASWAIGSFLEGERSVNGVTVRFYDPDVSVFFGLRADSAVVEAPGVRVLVVHPKVGMDYWGGLTPALAVIGLDIDSAVVTIRALERDTTTAPVPFPQWLRFSVGLRVSGRAVTLTLPDSAGSVAAGPVRFDTRGVQGARAELSVPLEGLPPLVAALEAHWRGRSLRYVLTAGSGPRDSLVARGEHDKADLRRGRDTVKVALESPDVWRRALATATTGKTASAPRGDSLAESGPLALVSLVRVEVEADWATDSLSVFGRFRTATWEPFEEAEWALQARVAPRGGLFSLKAAGAKQALDFDGRWNHPVSWSSSPPWRQWTSEVSGTVRGGEWDIAGFLLPLDFDVLTARLDTGFRVSARVKTIDGSVVDLRWHGRTPGRLELSGDIARGERWAVEWTEGNIDYAAALVEGVWENSALDVTARVREPRAYGAAADSLVAENRVTSSGYFLKRGRIYRDGTLFTGDGRVLWFNEAGEHDVSLSFDARHETHGRIGMAMRVPGPLTITADSLRPARFPYEPLRRLAVFDPWIDGRFTWDEVSGEGGSSVRIRTAGEGMALAAAADATWSRDSLKVSRLEAASGEARLSAIVTMPFDGRVMKWDGGANSLMSGSWSVYADRLAVGDIFDVARRSERLFRGVEVVPRRRTFSPVPPQRLAAADSGAAASAPAADSVPTALTNLLGGTLDVLAGTELNGGLSFSRATGMTGTLRLDSLRLPRHTGLADVTGVAVTGMGDSVRVDATLVTGVPVRWNDTLFAVFTGLNTRSPGFRAESRSTTGFTARVTGGLPEWRRLEGTMQADGRVSLPAGLGMLEDISFRGNLAGSIGRDFLTDLDLAGGSFALRHVSPLDTHEVRAVPSLSRGILYLSSITLTNPRGETMSGRAEFDMARGAASLSLVGEQYDVTLPGGERAGVRGLSTAVMWNSAEGLVAEAEARGGFFALPPSPARVETGFENVKASVALPPSSGAELSPASLKAQGQITDFVFQRRWGWRDATTFFTGIGRGNATPRPARARTRAWNLDVDVEAVGARNRIDTDVLRMNFAGDARLTGTYPYLLVNGKVTGLHGEVGQTRQAYVLRDFEIKWDNVTVEDGALHVEGEKRVRADCRPDTRQTCQIYVRLDGRLEDVGFTYETDCTQSSGDPVSPSVLINSMAQGCYVSETPGGEGNYGSAAFAMLEPALNDRLSRGFSRGSGGFIKSTQVSGLSALIGSDSSGLESVALEVESRRVYRTSLKGRAGYHPETKLANPMEYRLAAEYRPPLERAARDSVWRERLKDRFTVEAAVETRPEGRDVDEERRVRQRAGLRYRYRFWDLW